MKFNSSTPKNGGSEDDPLLFGFRLIFRGDVVKRPGSREFFGGFFADHVLEKM